MTDHALLHLIPPLPAEWQTLPVSRTHIMPRDDDEPSWKSLSKVEYWRKWREEHPKEGA